MEKKKENNQPQPKTPRTPSKEEQIEQLHAEHHLNQLTALIDKMEEDRGFIYTTPKDLK